MLDASGPTSDGKQLVSALADTLVLAYGLHPAEVTRIPAGTATVNYLVTDRSGAVTPSLQAYGRARHEAALVVLEHLDEIQQVLRDQLR